MIRDVYVKTTAESDCGKTSSVTNSFTSDEEACIYMRRVSREYANLKYYGIIKSYTIQCVSIAREVDEGKED